MATTEGSGPDKAEVYAFIFEKIDSVPHLEALLLLWETRPKQWTPGELAARLYVKEDAARRLLQELHRESLIAVVPGETERYLCESPSPERNALIGAVADTYRREVIGVSTLIHSKGSASVRDFARAFRFKKEST